MTTAPTVAAYVEAADWTVITATNTTPAASWNAGDLVVAVTAVSNVSNSNVTAVTATGLTFTPLQNMVDGNSAPSVAIWAAIAAAAGSDVITATQSATQRLGLAAWVISGSDGVGASVASTGPGTPSALALTRTGDDSIVIGGVFAWESALPTVTWEPAGQTQRRAALTGGELQLLADWPDQGPASTDTYGASAAGTATNFVVVAAEILGTAGGTPPPAGTAFSWFNESGVKVPMNMTLL